MAEMDATRACVVCGNALGKNDKRLCSDECRGIWTRRKQQRQHHRRYVPAAAPARECRNCAKIFTPARDSAVFCSVDCREGGGDRRCVVCGGLFPRDGRRKLCSDACKVERQLQYHRVDKHERQCGWCGVAFVSGARDKYCCKDHSDLAKARRDKERKARPDVRARTSELQKLNRKPSTELQRKRRRERRSQVGRGCRAKEYRASTRARAATRNSAAISTARVMASIANISAMSLRAQQKVRTVIAGVIRLAAKMDSRAVAAPKGAAASTLELKKDPEKYAAALSRWRAKSLKRKTGQAMRSDGTATSAVILGGKRCLYCDCILHEKNRTHDHMRPLSRGGVHSAANIAPCCNDCNSRKGAKGFEQWIATLAPKDSRRAVAYFEKRNGSIRQDGLVLAA